MDTIIDPVVETVPVAEATPILVSQPKPQQSVDWTATFWRFARTFINTFIGIVVASAATSFAGLGVVPINLANPRQTMIALILAFAIGFFTALGKALRDKYGDPSGAGAINKMPI